MICKMYGGMTVNGEKFVWDYAADEAVPESEMPVGSERHAQSERARWADALTEVRPKTDQTPQTKDTT
jgi:hypothetical protein